MSRPAIAPTTNRPGKRWTIVVDIGVDELAESVRAVARLHDRTSDRTVGVGSARTGPMERTDPAVAEDVATARP